MPWDGGVKSVNDGLLGFFHGLVALASWAIKAPDREIQYTGKRGPEEIWNQEVRSRSRQSPEEHHGEEDGDPERNDLDECPKWRSQTEEQQ